ncbi:hypothetical protein [Pseudoalteromonas sp. H71]|uniref:hypothetical protein n=1 Tax=Pseudoalteromonas sp. H71 TaxID=1348395 RepID=UPI000731977A|nr:hypothetical protein [Pseudoalteromonas sp. H71]KTD93251.1 hypothetical protein ATS71_17860 [Pseudoalteromonas sp. H71]
MDGEYTAVTFISILTLRKVQNARGAGGFQGAVGGIRPLGCRRQRDISKYNLKAALFAQASFAPTDLLIIVFIN